MNIKDLKFVALQIMMCDHRWYDVMKDVKLEDRRKVVNKVFKEYVSLYGIDDNENQLCEFIERNFFEKSFT